MENTITTQAEKMAVLIEQFSTDVDIVSFVKKTENSIATTRDHYGNYMHFLTEYASKPTALHVISRSLIMAGANVDGVLWAVKILKG